MPWYKCLIRGENFPGEVAGLEAPVGFYVTRSVQSSDPENAELDVVEMLRSEEKLRVLDDYSCKKEARVYVEEIVLLDDAAERPATGFAFFRMSDAQSGSPGS